MMDGIASSYNDMSDSESDDDKKQTVPNVAHAACIAHQAHYLAAASAESAAGSRQCARAGDTAEQEAINVQSGQAATVSKLPPSSRKIVPCKALLDDDTQHDDCSQQYVRSEASVTALLLAQRQVPPPSTAASSTADDESRAAVSVQVIEGNDISINRILSRPPVHIASLLSTSPGHRPGCRPPRRKIHSFSGHTASVMKLAWHCPGGQILASCGMDGLLCFWEPWVKRQCVKKMSPHKSLAIRCGMWYSTGSAGITTRNSGTGVADAASNPVHFLSGGYDKCLRLLDVEYDKCVVSLLHPHHVTAVARHPTHRSVVVTGTSQCSLAAWDVQSGKKLHDCTQAAGQVQDILFLPDNERFVVACDTHRRSDADKSLGVWDFASGVRLLEQLYPEPYSCTRLCMDKAQKNFLAQSNAGHTAIFQASPPYRLNKFKRFDKHQISGYPMGVSVSRDGQFLYSPSSTGHLNCYSYQTSKIVKSWPVGEQTILIDVAHHPLLPSALATSTWDGGIDLWM
ncbi:WD repeat-containing protein 25-like isoform X1 [Sycon ciliatum]|uniref:WD repeat-containing protein 25-like isoform X1 n=1 Tax=Sycon ciliatum TaxID=27933 RepID=UPI0031F684C2